MASLPLFDALDSQAAVIDRLCALLALAGTSDAHTASVEVDEPDGRSYTNYRVTPEVRDAFERLRIGVPDAAITPQLQTHAARAKAQQQAAQAADAEGRA